MTQSMRLYKKVFTELRWKKYFTQFRCSNYNQVQLKVYLCICVFVYLCSCVFVYLFEKNISQLNPGAATTINWKDVTPSLKAASFAAFNTQSILPDKLLPLCNIQPYKYFHKYPHKYFHKYPHKYPHKYSDKYWRRGSANLLHSLLAQFRPSNFVILSWTISFNTGFLP